VGRTLYYLAPEVARQRYGAEADAWSAGVMLYQLLAGRLPFTDEENEEPTTKGVLASILYSRLDLESPPWDRVSVAAKHLVRSLLERDVRKRLTVEDALNHCECTCGRARRGGGLTKNKIGSGGRPPTCPSTRRWSRG